MAPNNLQSPGEFAKTEGIEAARNVDFLHCQNEFTANISQLLQEEVQGLRAQNLNMQLLAAQAQKLHRQVVQAMVRVSETRDLYTSFHQRRVANLAREIAVQMGLTDEQVEGIHFTGLIHDIGKIGIPGEILCKTSPLNADEMGLVRRHSEIGYCILKDIDLSWPIALATLQHHERIDGSGYPQGLVGDEITLEAKIVAVSDVVEAMASARPYRAPLGIKFALNEISAQRGILYDSEVVDACLRLFENGFSLT